MSGDLIQAKYEALEEMATRFGGESEVVEELNGRVQNLMRSLQNGGWEGEGSQAFFTEMENKIFPATTRLTDALEQARTVTLQIKEILQAAEVEAARPFQGDGRSADDSGGFLSGAEDFFSGMYAEGKDMVTGLWNMVTDPIGTAKGLLYGITHPKELWNAIKQPYVDDWNNGHPWRAIGRGTMAIVTTILGAKGADKLAKALKGASVADDVARVGSLADDAGRMGSVADDALRAGSAIDDGARLINTTGRTLSEAESAVADLLASEGRLVEVVAEGTARTSDFLVDGVPTELKTVSNITSRDMSGALSSRILDGAGQAGNIIIDARGQVGLTQAEAARAIRRAYGADKLSRLQEIRIIGNGFEITVPRINP